MYTVVSIFLKKFDNQINSWETYYYQYHLFAGQNRAYELNFVYLRENNLYLKSKEELNFFHHFFLFFEENKCIKMITGVW